MRIDKIKKKISSNVIDLDVSKFDLKFDNFNYPLDHPNWYIKTKTSKTNINILIISNILDNKIELLKELKHFVKIQMLSLSENTIVQYLNIMKSFIYFCDDFDIKISKFSDINASNILQYTEYLKNKTGAYSKYRDFKNLITKISQTSFIKSDIDVINKNFPNLKLNKNTTKIKHYTEEEFNSLSKTITHIITDYLSGSKEITESHFVMTAYWFLSICTGFNETGLLSLKQESFENFKNDKDILTIIGEKNRSSKGYQFVNFNFNNKTNSLLFQTIDKLIEINNKNKIYIDSNSLFIHMQRNQKVFYIYNGLAERFIKTSTYSKYSKIHNCTVKPSTAKIRNFRSLYFFDKSKNEQIVSEMMNHNSIKTTIEHYIKQNITLEDNVGLFLVQKLLLSFSENTEFNDWSAFQKHFGLDQTPKEIVIKNLNDGFYNSPMGSCIKNTDIKENCTSYINCFKCKNYSVIGDKDLWKILSFKECLDEHLGDNKSKYEWLFDSINSILINFDRSQIKEAKNKLIKNRHPFWKNNIMIKHIIDEHERKYEYN